MFKSSTSSKYIHHFAGSCNILNRWKNCFSQLLNVHRVIFIIRSTAVLFYFVAFVNRYTLC
jgi:hypothetical protein